MVLGKMWGWLAVAAAVFGALNTAEVLAIVGPQVGTVISVISTVVAALSRALTDKDGDGRPDWSF
jgi:hypothetical protein